MNTTVSFFFLKQDFQVNQSNSTVVTSFILLFSEVTIAISFERRNLGNKLVDARNTLIDMHFIHSLKTYRHGYFSKQQNETGYYCGMTLVIQMQTNKQHIIIHQKMPLSIGKASLLESPCLNWPTFQFSLIRIPRFSVYP